MDERAEIGTRMREQKEEDEGKDMGARTKEQSERQGRGSRKRGRGSRIRGEDEVKERGERAE